MGCTVCGVANREFSRRALFAFDFQVYAVYARKMALIILLLLLLLLLLIIALRLPPSVVKGFVASASMIK